MWAGSHKREPTLRAPSLLYQTAAESLGQVSANRRGLADFPPRRADKGGCHLGATGGRPCGVLGAVGENEKGRINPEGPQRDEAPHSFREPGRLGDVRVHRTPPRRFDGVLAEPPLTVPRDTQLGDAGTCGPILWTTCVRRRCLDGATAECRAPPPLSAQSASEGGELLQRARVLGPPCVDACRLARETVTPESWSWEFFKPDPVASRLLGRERLAAQTAVRAP